MNKKENKIIIVIIALFLVLGALVILFGNKDKDDNIDLQGEEIIRLKDPSIYFGIQNVISYYTENYLFTAEKIFYNKNNDKIKYYFANGYLIDKYEGNSLQDNKNYLVIVKNNKYIIRELSEVNNIEEYAKNYELVNVDVYNGKEFNTSPLSNDVIIKSYLTNFKSLLSLNLKKAYNLLGEKPLSKYPTYDSFVNNISDIYDGLNIGVFSYSIVYDQDYKLIKIKNDDLKDIEIIEYYPNDYKINF